MASNRFDPDVISSRFLPVLQLFATGQVFDGLFINPSGVGLSPTSYIARLRDAVQAIRTGIYNPPPSFDQDIFFQQWGLYRMEEKGEQVVFKNRKGGSLPGLSVLQEQLVEVPCEVPLINAVALLLGRKVLKGPIKVLGVLGPKTIERITTAYDVVVELKDEHTLLI